jgi:hypothetical protein
VPRALCARGRLLAGRDSSPRRSATTAEAVLAVAMAAEPA